MQSCRDTIAGVSKFFGVLFARGRRQRRARIGIVDPNFRLVPRLSWAFDRANGELSEFIFRIIHNWGRHFELVRRHGLDEMDQTALLSANSIAAKFEFEIRRELTVPIGRNNFSARINRSARRIFEKCAPSREFGSKIRAENIISPGRCKNKALPRQTVSRRGVTWRKFVKSNDSYRFSPVLKRLKLETLKFPLARRAPAIAGVIHAAYTAKALFNSTLNRVMLNAFARTRPAEKPPSLHKYRMYQKIFSRYAVSPG